MTSVSVSDRDRGGEFVRSLTGAMRPSRPFRPGGTSVGRRRRSGTAAVIDREAGVVVRFGYSRGWVTVVRSEDTVTAAGRHPHEVALLLQHA